VHEVFARIENSGCPENVERSFVLRKQHTLNQEHTGIKPPIGLSELFVESIFIACGEESCLSSAFRKSVQAIDGVRSEM
jgi:hypothetical protein